MQTYYFYFTEEDDEAEKGLVTRSEFSPQSVLDRLKLWSGSLSGHELLQILPLSGSWV